MADAGLCAASTVAGCLVAPVNRLCGYVISYDGHVCKLEDKVAELGQASDRVQDSIREARDNMKPIKHYVNQWVTEVEKHAEEACRVLDDKAKITCFRGWLPNLKVRYRLGREARRKAERIQGLINQTPSGKVYDNPPPGLVDGASDVISSAGDRGDIIFDSRASILEEIMNALDDEKHKVIGIYGEGGVGKTTLLKQVEEKLRNEKRLFRVIAKANVSQNLDLKKIQDDIAYALSLKDLKDEPSEEGRKDLLCKRLQKDPGEKILIILDDLWKELDLREVGIPSGDESKGCKLLLTSRFKNVLEQMKCDTPVFHLEALNYGEAFRLFEKMVGNRLKDDEELKAIAPKVVKKLAGLPLLIISVACSLKDRDVDAWRIALKKIDLSKMETIVKLSYDHLKSEDTKSLFLLCGLIGGTIQVEILLVLGMGLGLFEEFGRTIQDSRAGLNAMLDELRSVCLLLDGGDDKNNVTIHDPYSLLLDGGDDKNNVTIHDLYSEVVTSTPFGGQNSLMMNSNYGSWPKEKLEKCWAICQVNVGRDGLDKLMECQFADLKILMLSQPPKWYRIPVHLPNMEDHLGLLDFTCMKELRVLYLCSMRITSLHYSIRILGNLHSLFFVSCNVEDVAILSNLKALQILSFAGSTISRLPKEIGELTNLRLLNLNYCNLLKIIEPNALKCLTNLEELHMMESFDRWMGKNEKPSELSNVGLAELRSMTNLNSLEISICDPIILLEVDDLPFENLTRFWINIGNVDKWNFKLNVNRRFGINIGNVGGREFKVLKTMKIKLEGDDSILSKKWIRKTLQKTQYLCLDGLGEFKKAHELFIQEFPQLKHLNIQNSPSIKYFANSFNSTFMILESLVLDNLINLEKIFHSHITTKCFSKLKAVRVGECNRLKYLWCLSQMQNLVQLEEIKIWTCGSMRAIARKDIVSANCRVDLPYLRCLCLVELSHVTSFCTGAEITLEGAPIQAGVVDGGGGDEGTESVTITSDLQNTYSDSFFDGKISLPNLEDLVLASVGSFERIWHNELSKSSFCKLATIIVENCSDLLHIFPSTIIGRLHNLQCVKVYYCPSLKSLFDFGSLDSNTEQNVVLLPELVRIDVISCPSLESLFNCGSLDSNAEHKIILLPKLENVRVSGAKKLRHVVMSHFQIVLSFPSLETVDVENCSDLRYLFPKYTATTLMKLEQLTIRKCKQMKEVILEKETARSEAEVMSFPCLSTLKLNKLENLISFGSRSVERQLGETSEENYESPQPLFNEMVTFPNMRYLEIEGVPCKELWNNHVPADSVVCSHQFLLVNVKVKNCQSLKSLFDFGSLDSNTEQNVVLLPELVRINVESCPSLESLFNCGSLDSNAEHQIILLPKLEQVSVSGAKKLRHVVRSHSQIVLSFPSLKIVDVGNCSDLRYLFPKYTATTLMKLERLIIRKCKQMKEVILEKETARSEAEVMSFPCLSTLKLNKLENLISFGSRSVERQLGETSEENYESPQPLFNEMVTFPNMRYLEIEGVPCKELWNNHVPADSVVCSHQFLLVNVKVKNCQSLKSLFDFGSLDSNTEQNAVLLPKLVRINVESCPSLESLFNCGSLDSNAEHKIILLPKLEQVSVSGAKKLRHVVRSHSQIVLGFPSLKIVDVENCSDLRYLFPKYMATTLTKLEWLIISKCKQMKEVILEKEAGRSEAEVMSFPCLSTLRLEELDNLIGFGSGSVKKQLGETSKENDGLPQPLFNEMVIFPNITSLEISGLQCKELWNNQIPTDSFQKLESLELKNCDNLQRIATSYMWKKLQRCLKNLEVISCRLIEVIYEGDGTDIESGELGRLVLRDLGNLRCIWQSDSLPNISFSNLRDVEVVRCSHLEMLFPTFMAKFLGQIEELVVESCEDMELIAGHEKWEEVTGTTITFSKLTALRLFKLPKFKSFLPEKYSMKFLFSEDFPSLRIMSIESCGAEPDQVHGNWEDYQKGRRFRWFVRHQSPARVICWPTVVMPKLASGNAGDWPTTRRGMLRRDEGQRALLEGSW